ncbi:Nn.00g076860.m01.CDS01 [Neocucurbitaria sp. VM-36]
MASSNPDQNSSTSTPVPFPQPGGLRDTDTPSVTAESPTTETRQRTSTTASTASSRLRTASIKLMEATPPPGMWAATGTTASKAPSLSDIRKGSFGSEGWNEETQRKRAGSRASQAEERSPTDRTSGTKRRASSNNALSTEPFPALTEEETQHVPGHGAQDKGIAPGAESKHSSETAEKINEGYAREPMRTPSGQYANGYVPPPKLPWKRSFVIGLKGFWKWFLTPSGFLITLYGLNVVAWGGMLFLLLCNAAPAMCVPDCNDINSPRRKWIEYDSQILNSLFCVTGFGLAPWRFRDLYWWGWWRLGGSKRKEIGIRRLAGLHRGWFRLPGSDQLPEEADAKFVDPENPAVPIPVKSIPDPPPTGIRAPPTKSWKMDFVLWNNAWNTFFQIVLCFYMWHYNRIQRPSWATGLFVALGCIVAGIAGIMMWHEGKNIKKVEGVPMRKDYEDSPADVEAHSAQNIPLVATGKAANP